MWMRVRAFSESTNVSSCTSGAAMFNFQWLGSMRLELAILSIAAIVCACRTHKEADRISPDAPAVVFRDYRREHDTGFSAHEQTLVAGARRYLEQSEHRRIDAYFRVRRTFDGNEVIVMAVSGYDERSQPVFDKYCTVVLSDDVSTLRIFPVSGGWSLIGQEPMKPKVSGQSPDLKNFWHWKMSSCCDCTKYDRGHQTE